MENQTEAEVSNSYAVFEGTSLLAAGTLADVAIAARTAFLARPHSRVLIFDPSGRTLEIDLRGSDLSAYRFNPGSEPLIATAPQPPGPGRPKLGVIAREVTLLPRHWEWLNDQPGGASVALRKLVEDARKNSWEKDAIRHGQEAAYRFLTAIAGDLPGFEEALRALFAGDADRFDTETTLWPGGLRGHAVIIAGPALKQK